MSETQIKYIPRTSVLIKEEDHPHFIGKKCWRAYTETGRRVGWTDVSRDYLVSQLKGHTIIEK